MKLITGILVLGAVVGTACAQNPDVIQDTRDTLKNVQQKQTIDQNAVLSSAGQAPSNPSPAAATPAPSKPAANPASSPAASAKSSKPANSNSSAPAASAKASKPVQISVTPVKSPKAAEKAAPAKEKAKAEPAPAPKPTEPTPAVAVEDKKTPADPKKEEKTYSSIGKRDPFISPVVSRSISGSGCSSGKRCLAIDQIALTGIIKSDSGMIAVVVNALNKAYFLRESDPVFNGYVVKITPDSIIFKETIQDKLGKSFEREVTKKISTPAV